MNATDLERLATEARKRSVEALEQLRARTTDPTIRGVIRRELRRRACAECGGWPGSPTGHAAECPRRPDA